MLELLGIDPKEIQRAVAVVEGLDKRLGEIEAALARLEICLVCVKDKVYASHR